ncbi:hypothetical protein FV139_14580 [Parahaliea maris]|uniref:NHL repeat-containing protein n=2 Tax=Parahaliea maris TaxID=2716870 RepID=A0A5C8ZUJ5_9GAMM|nr:hypothetical protein FV139_14580 [Parahaliea maris]
MLSGLPSANASATATDAADVPQALVPAKVQQLNDRPIPRFAVDAAWPQVPDDLTLGQIPGVAVDRHDNVWIIQRPNSLDFSDNGLAQSPPTAVCCRPAPHVMQFSSAGDYLGGWGGSDQAPRIDGVDQWPQVVHGIFVDDRDSVWIGGNGKDDHVVLNFSADGEFIRQYGIRGVTGGNSDREALGNPADIHHDTRLNEVLVADGYTNKRVIGFDSARNTFSRLFGAYGKDPDGGTREGDFDQSQASSNADGGANPEAGIFGDIVHCVSRGPDGMIYVCDRRNNRIQVFNSAEDGAIRFVRNLVIAGDTGGLRTASDIAWSPDGKFMYVADMMNGQVWILDAADYAILGALGRNGRYAGEFIWLHSVDVDSKGNLYTSEVSTGRRVQKFVLTGVE